MRSLPRIFNFSHWHNRFYAAFSYHLERFCSVLRISRLNVPPQSNKAPITVGNTFTCSVILKITNQICTEQKSKHKTLPPFERRGTAACGGGEFLSLSRAKDIGLCSTKVKFLTYKNNPLFGETQNAFFS